MKTNENKSEKEWREKLTEEQFHILRNKGTEPVNQRYGSMMKNNRRGLLLNPFSGKTW